MSLQPLEPAWPHCLLGHPHYWAWGWEKPQPDPRSTSIHCRSFLSVCLHLIGKRCQTSDLKCWTVIDNTSLLNSPYMYNPIVYRRRKVNILEDEITSVMEETGGYYTVGWIRGQIFIFYLLETDQRRHTNIFLLQRHTRRHLSKFYLGIKWGSDRPCTSRRQSAYIRLISSYLRLKNQKGCSVSK